MWVFFLADHLSTSLRTSLGSSSLTTDANGVKTASALYKAFGETRYTDGNLGTDYKFTGQREEASLGIYFFNARWMDPSLGRFTSPDTIVPTGTQGTQAWDRYAFVNNNPVRYNDPTGHQIDQGDEGGGATCGGYGQPPCSTSGEGGGSGDGGEGGGGEGDEHHGCLEDIVKCYKQGWTNAASAVTVLSTPDLPAIAYIYAFLYLYAWGVAHYGLAVGVAALAYAGISYILRAAGGCAVAIPCRERVFWSGGEIAKKAAEAYAKSSNGITLGQTITGRAISLLDKVLPYPLTKPLWDSASAQFARGASGTVNSFLYLPAYNPSGTWATIEKIMLQANPNVTNIIENIVP